MNFNEIHDEQHINDNEITNVIINDNFQYVGDFAYANCLNLKDVTIGNNVTYLGENCFEQCINLQNVVFNGNKLKSILPYTFHFCVNIKRIILPEGIEDIQDFAFSCCHNLEYIELPITCKRIGFRAFFKCNSLKAIKFNNNMILESQSFMWCDNLTNINSDKIHKMHYDTFKCCTQLEQIRLKTYDKVCTLA